MAEDLTEEQIMAVMQGIRIPPQPQILVDLQMEQFAPAPDIKRISQLIGQDVGLSGTVLKVVNSPLYSLPNEITSVSQAVSLIGLNSVINVINGLAIKSQLSDDKITQLNRFWDTATDIAHLSASLANQLNFSRQDLAYLLGLFHNCGIPLLMMRFDNYFDVMEMSYADPELRVVDIENRELNTNHAVIGYYTAKSWRLPRILCDVIAEHHNATRYFNTANQQDSDEKTLVAILKVAEHICGNYRILGRQSEDLEWQACGQEVLAYLGIGEFDLEQLQDSYAENGIGLQNYRH